MGKLTDDEIRQRILNKNKNANILDIQRIHKSGKSRIMIKLKCECGIEFTRELSHLTDNYATCLCGHCAQKIAHNSRKLRYNEKYNRMLKRLNISLINEDIKNLYARDKVEVKNSDGFIFFWSVGEKIKREMIFNPSGLNYKNFKYNLLRHSEINGYGCKDIETNKNSEYITVTCECGNKYTCKYGKFLNGKYRCNECTNKVSSYEKIFENFLKENSIEYIYQYRISSCKFKKPLPFDFLISNPRVLVEIQGEQHYKPIRFNNCDESIANENFKNQKIRDNIKLNFCKEKNIKLLVFSYKDILDGSYKSKIIDIIQTHV